MKFIRSTAIAALAIAAAQAVAQEIERSAPSGASGHASDVLGARVRDARGEDLGEIEDLAFAADGRITTAIISVGGFLDIGDRLVAVPFGRLSPWTDGETFRLSLDEREFSALPEYTPGTPPPLALAAAPAAAPQDDIQRPDAVTQAEAQEEAEEIFAADDPRVAEGIAENKEAYEDKQTELTR